MITGRRSSENLPAELIRTARALFDRLSPRGAPINYHDFAVRWPEFQQRASERFPSTFLDCLRRVTPPNGMLTFERFCAGLRLAVAEERENHNLGRQQMLADPRATAPQPPTRGNDSAEKTKQLMPMYGSTHPPPYNVALSRSRLNLEAIDQQNAGNKLNALLARSTPHLCEKPTPNGSTSDQNRLPQKAANGVHQRNSSSRPSSVQSTETNGSLEGIKFREKSVSSQIQSRASQQPRAVVQDSRRHTMVEGSESSVSQSKHLRLMQEEKQLLIKAADTATRLHNWYNERLSSLETREKLIGKSMIPVDFAVHEEKLNYLRAHITEVNRRAVALMESSDKGFPWHMNLELHRNIPQPADDQLMWMKRQNKSLTNEVAEKSERIAQLETEKARLIKQLCESSNHKFLSQQNGCRSSSGGGTDSGFHSLTHQASPLFPSNPNPGPNGQRPLYAQSNVVYATPAVINEPKYRDTKPVPPTHYQKIYAEMHEPPTVRQGNGILATFM